MPHRRVHGERHRQVVVSDDTKAFRRTHNGYERVTKGRIVGYATDLTEVVFDEAVAPGMYVLAVYTRCGHSEGYRVVRVSRKVRALA